MTLLGMIAFGLVIMLLMLFAAIGLLYATRGTPLSHVSAVGDPGGPPAVSEPLFRNTIELLAETKLSPGHHVEVMINGDETYPRLWEDLRSAERSITLQFYYANPGRMADTLKDILLDRARAGVRILFLHDAFGSQTLSREYLDTMRLAGIEIAGFRPTRWYSLHKSQQRSHSRVVIVDGRVGWTGGFGIDDKWYGDGRHEGQWRDTNARFEGPAVMQLQATFACGWVEATGQLITGELFFPLSGFTSGDGATCAGVLHTAPTIGSTTAERFLALSIVGARKTMYIANSYFVPDDDFRNLLTSAARRGVDVRILTTSDKTDVKTTWRAGRACYDELLRAGVRIYEYQPTMMHAKTFVIDGVWSTVGTMNFDNRSLSFNDESNLMVLDAQFGAKMNAIFLEDLRSSREITLDEFRRRPRKERLLEWGASRLARIL